MMATSSVGPISQWKCYRPTTGQDVLGGEDVVPGFEIRVAENFLA